MTTIARHDAQFGSTHTSAHSYYDPPAAADGRPQVCRLLRRKGEEWEGGRGRDGGGEDAANDPEVGPTARPGKAAAQPPTSSAHRYPVTTGIG